MNDRAIIVCDLLSTAEAASYLEVSKLTLARMRRKGTGPKFILLGENCLKYRTVDLNDYLLAKTYTSRSDYTICERVVTWAKFRTCLELLAPYQILPPCSDDASEHDDTSIRGKFIYITALADLGESALAEFAGHIARMHLDRCQLHVLLRAPLSDAAKDAIHRAQKFVFNRETDAPIFHLGETEEWTRVWNRKCFDAVTTPMGAQT